MLKTKREEALEKDMRFAAVRLYQAWLRLSKIREVEGHVKKQVELLEVAEMIEQALLDLDIAECMPSCAGNYHE